MHPEILTSGQIQLLPLIKKFASQFGLVGGTAVALQLGHRRSIDFDLFSQKEFNNDQIMRLIKKKYPVKHTYIDSSTELTIMIEDIKLTFYAYPYKIPYSETFEKVIKMPDLLTLAAMKAFALGRRAKWKDYVDLYSILQNYPFKDIVKKTKRIFKGQFNEKLFREQLSYFKDINYSEPIEYLPGMVVSDEAIKQELKKIAVS